MKKVYKSLVVIVIAILIIVGLKVNYESSKIDARIIDSVRTLMNSQQPDIEVLSSSDADKLTEFKETINAQGYTDIEISGYMPDDEDNVYILGKAKNKDEKIGNGIFYITVRLTENQNIESLIISSIVKIREDKENF